MERSGKVATPFTAFWVRVPERVPPHGFALRATVTGAVEVVTVLPKASWKATRTAGVMVAPAVAVDGAERNASRIGTTPPVMSKGAEVAEVRPVELAVRV